MHEHFEIPWGQLIIPQIVNFTIFVGLLIFIIRKPLREHFTGKSEQFETHRRKAQEAKATADRKHYDAEVQLRELENNAQSSLKDAEHEAKSLKEKMIGEAKNAAKRSAEEAETMAMFEYQRALALLKTQIVESSVVEAEASLKKQVDAQAKSRLNDEFVHKLQAAAK
jgi:F0F1-type ATP synthase membrane subunit b/b'